MREAEVLICSKIPFPKLRKAEKFWYHFEQEPFKGYWSLNP